MAEINLRKMKQLIRKFSSQVGPSPYQMTSGLYVPGNQERMLNKCVGTKASLLVPDMEDSVPLEEKATARNLIRSKLKFLRENSWKGRVITPRTNGVETGTLFEEDIDGVIDKDTYQCIDGFCLPMVDVVEDMQVIEKAVAAQEQKYNLPRSTFKVIPQIESTKSITYLKEILEYDQKTSRRVVACVLGGDDLTADFEIFRPDNGQDREELDYFRKVLASTCHAFGVVSMDTPFVNFKNLEGLRDEMKYLKKIGIKGKFAIHPTQIDIINQELGVSEEEVKYYQSMVEVFEREGIAKGKAACVFDNKMIDIAAFRRAQAILAKAKLMGQ